MEIILSKQFRNTQKFAENHLLLQERPYIALTSCKDASLMSLIVLGVIIFKVKLKEWVYKFKPRC